MRVALIGRTSWLLEAGRRIAAAGHVVAVVWTCAAESFYDVKEADFAELARDCSADFVCDVEINSDQAVQRLRSYGCDLAVSVNWLTRLRPKVLGLFPMGVLNAHAGDLPRFRGNACPNWAILANEPHVGLCVHFMVEELDAGPILLRDRYPLTSSTYIGDVYDWLNERIPTLLAAGVDALATGTARPEQQPTEPQSELRAYPRRPEDARIDWSRSVERVMALIRASSRPFDGAFAFLEGSRKVTVWRATHARHAGQFLAVPGQVCFRIERDPVVACADGLIRLTDVALEGVGSSEQAKSEIGNSLRNRLT
jgi:methionyl-tRNA formyltransferase